MVRRESHLTNNRVVALAIVFCLYPSISFPQQSAPPSALKDRIAAADPKSYRNVTDAVSWKNPFLMVYADGIEVRKTGADKAGLKMPVENVIAFLEKLPNAAWPYGLVVAVAENGIIVTGSEPNQGNNTAALLSQLSKFKIKAEFWGSE